MMNTKPSEPTVHDLASEDDRQWFLDHRNREYRLREPLPGEVRTVPGRTALVVVRRVHPKARMRLPFYVEWPKPAGEAPEYIAEGFFKHCTSLDPRISEMVGAMREACASAPNQEAARS
ncbi:hypothetical protein GXW71_28250 [Roseomonas hellenica]|uniref:Uncharacterized protein n=1 Tax=Plastoroseomonas hellenica TaxID=2687306 RepID=A0ABS5F6U7_9PROT|nr:hypothetical protein [Plastoroseomonas hellenica]MBR0668277.1 hypothetical protein [Plastoroseomonas hellenica]